MESESDQPEKKKRRVTKACDQCRKRRIKCASYPNVALDAPCVICTEANQAASCTYTRPTRKRGPQPGKSLVLQEKCEALERLLGHLIIAVPSIATHVEVFFRNSSADSPDSVSPSSASSSVTQPTTVEQQIEAYRSSRIAQRLGIVVGAPPPPPEPAPSSAGGTKGRLKREAESPASSPSAPPPFLPSNDDHPHLLAPSPLQSSFFRPESSLSSYPDAPYRPSYPFPQKSNSSASPFDNPTNALQALAYAAVPDPEHAMEGVFNTSRADPPRASRGDRLDRLEIPLLPSESIRNQLLDLFFNQVCQPSFPMLDKALFLRWSAHLPAVPTRTTTSLPSSRLIPPPLYLAVFALTSSYLPPSVVNATHHPALWAEAARNHLWTAIEGNPTLETVQAAVLGIMIDWGAGDLEKAWIVSSIAIALSINLSLHLTSPTEPDPSSLKLKTFHSALILHTLLSLRLSRAPLVVLEDYNVPIPPVDGNENYELWRADKTTTELREDWRQKGTSTAAVDSPRPNTGAPRAVRSASLSTFAKMASLCAIGLAILRWDICPRRGYGQSLATGEQERIELIESLRRWGDTLENELRLGSDTAGGVERLEERARWSVEMHLVVAALNSKLKPHQSLAKTVFDPVPSALTLLHHVLIRYRSLFTMYRSLPVIEFPLHTLSASLFEQNDYTPHQHDAPLKAYEELGRLFPAFQTSFVALRRKVDGHKRELGLLRGVHPTASTVPPPSSPTPANIALSEPFQAFLSYSADLGPAATPQNVLDFGSWDQTDLLFSLGLVGSPNGTLDGWNALASGEGQDALSFPPMIEADFEPFEGARVSATEPRRSRTPDVGAGVGSSSQVDQALLNFASSSIPSNETSFRQSNGAIQSRFDASIFEPPQQKSLQQPEVRHHPDPDHSSSSSSAIYAPSYPSAPFLDGDWTGSRTMDASGDLDGAGERSTDLLAMWLSRGSVS
ncbi:hypothetical protein JCM16303_004163 [Sporobolomyces ruberrimus]